MFNNNHPSHTGLDQTSGPSQSLQLKPVMSEKKVCMTPLPSHHRQQFLIVTSTNPPTAAPPPSPSVHTSQNEIHDNAHDVIHVTATLGLFFFFLLPGGSSSPQPAGVTETWGSSGGGVTA